jgi:hypothetical protein
MTESVEGTEGATHDDHPPSADVVPSRAGGRPWMDRIPPVLAEVWSLAEKVPASRHSDQTEPRPSGEHRQSPGVHRGYAGGERPGVATPRVAPDDTVLDSRPWVDWEPTLSAVYVFWRARVRLATPRAVGRLTRVMDELTVYPKMISPFWDWEPGDPTIGFGFWVDGPTYAAAAVITAKRALDYALRQALVGTPKPPPGTSSVALAIELEDYPTVRFEGFEEGW